jgi:O-antigen/teichoic acid export membrane protein
MSYYNNRKKDFKNIAQANVLKSSTQVTANLGIHFLKTGPAGLIIGQAIAFWAGNIRLAKKIKNELNLFKEITKNDIRSVRKRYIDFPKFSMPSILANVLSQNLTNIITSVLFNSATLGFYSFANRILGTPIAIIGQSIGQVYMNEAAEQRRKTGKATKIFNTTLKRLFLISVPLFVIAFFTLEDIFAFIFGEEWRIAGKYAIILLPLFLARFVAAPLSLTNIVFEKQKIALMWQIGLLSISLLVYLVIYLKHFDFETFLYIYSFVLFLYYIFLIFIVKKVANGKL